MSVHPKAESAVESAEQTVPRYDGARGECDLTMHMHIHADTYS